MRRRLVLIVICFVSLFTSAQTDEINKQNSKAKNDSIRKADFLNQIGNGYFPTRYFNIDLRYLIKFNQYEGVRSGLGGMTSENFSEVFRLNGYWVYGFRDKRAKYSIGGGFRLNKERNTWLNFDYTDDLQETGSSNFLTDSRFFTFFEPRLINISLFHKHITKTVSLEHKLLNNLLTETELAISKIEPTYDYTFVTDAGSFRSFEISTAKIGVQWSPFSKFKFENDRLNEIENGFPKFTFQFTKSFENVINGDFNFAKIDFKTIYQLNYSQKSFSSVTLVAGLALGETPLTHLYHAYPNNINKETILQRFSVAGLNSFETMFFNEFFSDRFVTLQLKHYFKPFEISQRFKPQLVLINRYAIGTMNNIDKHQGITFNTLDQIYTESGFEINKLLFGFGLSFSYRYGAYHLPNFEDNVALKFTFNISL